MGRLKVPGFDAGSPPASAGGLLTTPIESPSDPRLAPYRRLQDPAALARSGLFVAEGRLVVSRLLALPRYRVQSLLMTPAAHAAFARDEVTSLLDGATPCYVVGQDVMNEIVGFNIHRGCLALAERPPVARLDEIAIGAARVLVLEGINNPDNVGGIFRSAVAFGGDTVVLGPACGDPLYRKAIRTSMAATLHVPFANAGTWPDAIDDLRQRGLRTIALTTALDATGLETRLRHGGPTALVLGNEGTGLTAAAAAACDERIRIPMRPGVDSLNVTVAASIAMHWLWWR